MTVELEGRAWVDLSPDEERILQMEQTTMPVDHHGTALKISDVVRRHDDDAALGTLIAFTSDGTGRAIVAWTHTGSVSTAQTSDLVKSTWRPVVHPIKP